MGGFRVGHYGRIQGWSSWDDPGWVILGGSRVGHCGGSRVAHHGGIQDG